MWLNTLFALTLTALGVLILPLPRIRQWMLNIVDGIAHVAVLAVIMFMGVLVFYPESAPETLTTAFAPYFRMIQELLPQSPAGLAWLLLVIVLVAVCLPLLALVDAARSQARYTNIVRGLLEDAVRQMSSDSDEVPVQAESTSSSGNRFLEFLRATTRSTKSPKATVYEMLRNR